MRLNEPIFLQKPMNEWPKMKPEPVAEEKMELKKDRSHSNPFVTLTTTLTANIWVFDRKEIFKVVKGDPSVSLDTKICKHL